MEVPLDLADDTVLAVVDLVEDVKPVIDSHWARVELDTVNIGCGCAIDSLGRAIFPHGAEVTICAVRITARVDTGHIRLIQIELGSDLLSPPGVEVVLRDSSHAQDVRLILISKVLVLFAVASSARSTEIHEVRHELVDLIRVDVIGQREGG